MSDANIFWKNIKTLYAYTNTQTGFGYELRIGQWVKDGRELDIVLAKQSFKETVSGHIIWGTIKGLGANDLYRIFDMAREIADIMKFPLPKELEKQKVGLK